MARPKNCSLCNAMPPQAHQKWCPLNENAIAGASTTEEFQASIIQADQDSKRAAWYKAGGLQLANGRRLSGETWEPGYSIAQYVEDREFARERRLWEEAWFAEHPEAEGYEYGDMPEHLRVVQKDTTDEAKSLPRGPNGLADWSKPSFINL